MKIGTAALFLFAGSQALAACGHIGHASCSPGQTPAVSDVLYFGTSGPAGTVSAEDWSDFLRGAVTPRFPEGLTVWRASGQWRAADGTIAREGSYVLSVVHAESDAAEAAVRAIASEYKARFHQEAVLRVKSRACVSY